VPRNICSRDARRFAAARLTASITIPLRVLLTSCFSVMTNFITFSLYGDVERIAKSAQGGVVLRGAVTVLLDSSPDGLHSLVPGAANRVDDLGFRDEREAAGDGDVAGLAGGPAGGMGVDSDGPRAG